MTDTDWYHAILLSMQANDAEATPIVRIRWTSVRLFLQIFLSAVRKFRSKSIQIVVLFMVFFCVVPWRRVYNCQTGVSICLVALRNQISWNSQSKNDAADVMLLFTRSLWRNYSIFVRNDQCSISIRIAAIWKEDQKNAAKENSEHFRWKMIFVSVAKKNFWFDHGFDMEGGTGKTCQKHLGKMTYSIRLSKSKLKSFVDNINIINTNLGVHLIRTAHIVDSSGATLALEKYYTISSFYNKNRTSFPLSISNVIRSIFSPILFRDLCGGDTFCPFDTVALIFMCIFVTRTRYSDTWRRNSFIW